MTNDVLRQVRDDFAEQIRRATARRLEARGESGVTPTELAEILKEAYAEVCAALIEPEIEVTRDPDDPNRVFFDLGFY